MLKEFTSRFPALSGLLFFLPVFALVTAVYLMQADSPALAQCSRTQFLSTSSGSGASAFVNKTIVVGCSQKIKSHSLVGYTGTLGENLCVKDAVDYDNKSRVFLGIRFNAGTFNRPEQGKCSWKVVTTEGATDKFHLQVDSVPFELTAHATADADSSEGEEKQ